ncbi:phage tail protein I [Fastidiosibacter lacustris]|uniref:phage tail protein I n=1 Tax=Fastidiosibacter lacustris TaxID=2056695 RepID=UPI000E343656|nr:phage tail protein I [Fastidiosibacter lacustris]
MSLLPPNSTDLEKAMIGAFEGVLNGKDWLINKLWNADLCPYEFLPYLASALSVDFAIYNNLTEAEKREYIKKSIEIHRQKGTLGALKKALNITDYDIAVEEWYEYNGTPHTIKVNITKQSPGAFNTDLISNTINANKNVQTVCVLSVKTHAYNTIKAGNKTRAILRQGIPTNKVIAFVGCGVMMRLRFK